MREVKKIKLSKDEIRALKKIQKLIEKAIEINSKELGFYVLNDELEQFLIDVKYHMEKGYKILVEETEEEEEEDEKCW